MNGTSLLPVAHRESRAFARWARRFLLIALAPESYINGWWISLKAERILCAADYPYESLDESVEFLDSASIPEAAKHKIYHGNAERLSKLTK